MRKHRPAGPAAHRLFPYSVLAWYGEQVADSAPGKRGARPNELAFEAKLGSLHLAELEYSVAVARPEIGGVILTGPDGVHRTYDELKTADA